VEVLNNLLSHSISFVTVKCYHLSPGSFAYTIYGLLYLISFPGLFLSLFFIFYSEMVLLSG